MKVTRRDFLKKNALVSTSAALAPLAADARNQPDTVGSQRSTTNARASTRKDWSDTRKNDLNIVLVIIDTLRYDCLCGEHSDRIKTPHMDRLARRSRVFHRAYSNSYPTIPMRTDVMTGQYGVPFNPWKPLDFDVTTLPRVLGKAGYCTQLIHDTPHLVNGGHAFDWPFHAWTPVRGAEVDRPWIDDKGFSYLENWKPDSIFDFLCKPEMPGARSHTMFTYTRANRDRSAPEDWNTADLFLTASRFLQDNSRRDNFFLWIDSFDPHEPWDAPPEYVRMYDDTPGFDGKLDPRAFWGGNRHKDFKNKPKCQRRIKAQYAAKVTHLDHWFGEFMDTLEATGLDENTAVILTADHGTVWGENGEFGKRGGRGYCEPEGHVPFTVYVPGMDAGSSNAIVQPQDVFSTVLGIAGIREPEEADGFDVISQKDTPREVGLMGARGDARHWQRNKNAHIFTVFDEDWVLRFATNPDACSLFRTGDAEHDVAKENPKVVKQLWKAGIDEMRRRGLPSPLIDWLNSGGQKPFPSDCADWVDRPANWRPYWARTYNRW